MTNELLKMEKALQDLVLARNQNNEGTNLNHRYWFEAGYRAALNETESSSCAAREEQSAISKAIIDALRILQDRSIGSPEACERAQHVLVAGLSSRCEVEELPGDPLAVLAELRVCIEDGLDGEENHQEALALVDRAVASYQARGLPGDGQRPGLHDVLVTAVEALDTAASCVLGARAGVRQAIDWNVTGAPVRDTEREHEPGDGQLVQEVRADAIGVGDRVWWSERWQDVTLAALDLGEPILRFKSVKTGAACRITIAPSTAFLRLLRDTEREHEPANAAISPAEVASIEDRVGGVADEERSAFWKGYRACKEAMEKSFSSTYARTLSTEIRRADDAQQHAEVLAKARDLLLVEKDGLSDALEKAEGQRDLLASALDRFFRSSPFALHGPGGELYTRMVPTLLALGYGKGD